MEMNRSMRRGLRTQNFITGLLLAAILALAAFSSDRFVVQWDWTLSGKHTLAEQSVRAIESFPEDISAVVFVQQDGERREEARRLLERYRVINPNLEVHYIDPDLDPAAARREEITTYGTVLFRTAERTEKVTELTEQAITNALIRLAKGTRKTIALITGHGEHALAEGRRDAYSRAVNLLKGEGYEVIELNLAGAETIPETVSVVILAGPRRSLLPLEISRLSQWQEQQGRLLVMRNPNTETGLEPYLASLGIHFQEGLVLDQVSQLVSGSPTTPMITTFDPNHPITRDMTMTAFFAEASGVEIDTGPHEGLTATRLFAGADRGWLEKGDLSSGRAAFDASQDLKGPIWLGVAAETETVRVVALSDSDFASDAYVNASGNIDLFLNVVRWLAEDEDFIAIRPREVTDAGLELTPIAGYLLFWGFLVIIPLALITAGVTIWARRKKR